MTPQNLLAEVRVVDLTRNLAGPYCTVALGDFGADVIKIEEPQRGDDTRAWAPALSDGESAIFASANRNKRSVAVNLNHPEGQAIVQALVARADVLVESFRPGALDRRGLGWETCRELNDRLIYCSISAFGRIGPRAGEPGYDPVVQAATGIMSITGERDGPPVRLGIAALDLGSGLWATVGILAALAAREQSGRGCRVDTSLFETAAWWLSYHLAIHAATGKPPGRHGSASPAIAPYEAFATSDGDLFVAAGNDRLFAAVCAVTGLETLPRDARFATNEQRVAHYDELHRLLEERFLTRPADVWETLLQSASVPCSRVRDVAEFAVDEHAVALGLFPDVDGQQTVALPLTLDSERPKPQRGAPRLGEHTDEVLFELGFDTRALHELRSTGAIA